MSQSPEGGDPEQKRKIIGNLFIDIFKEEAGKLEGISYLAQGTICPDVIESAGAKSDKAHVSIYGPRVHCRHHPSCAGYAGIA